MQSQQHQQSNGSNSNSTRQFMDHRSSSNSSSSSLLPSSSQQHQQQQSAINHQQRQQSNDIAMHVADDGIDNSATMQRENHGELRTMPISDGTVIEEISSTLGFPDLYYDLHRRGDEWKLDETAAQQGFVDDSVKSLRLSVYGSFITSSDQERIDSFYATLKMGEETLREGWKSFSTIKSREEKSAMFQDAVRATQCANPKIPLPKLKYAMDREQWILNLADYTKPLRDLTGQIPIGFLLSNRNVVDKLVAERVPVVRAVWFIKMISNQPKETDAQMLCKRWTETIIEILDALFAHSHKSVQAEKLKRQSREPRERKSMMGDTELYMMELVSHCLDEKMMDVEALEKWFIDKLAKSKENPFSSKSGATNVGIQESLLASKHADYSISVDKLSQFLTEGTEPSFSRFFSLLLHRVTSERPQSFLQALQQHNIDPLKLIEATPLINNLQSDNEQLTTSTIDSLDNFFVQGQIRKICESLLFGEPLRSVQDIAKLKPLLFQCIRWSHSRSRFDRLRPCVVATILKKLHVYTTTYVPIPEHYAKTPVLQDILFEYLDTCVSRDDDLMTICNLYSELIYIKVFSQDDYIRTLISHGSLLNLEASVHHTFLEHFALPEIDNPYFANQRSVVLFGLRREAGLDELSLLDQLQNQADLLFLSPPSTSTDASLQDFRKRLQEASNVIRVTVCNHIANKLPGQLSDKFDRFDLQERRVLMAVSMLYEYGIHSQLFKFIRHLHTLAGWDALAVSLMLQFDKILIAQDHIKAHAKLIIDRNIPIAPLALHVMANTFNEPLALPSKGKVRTLTKKFGERKPITISSEERFGTPASDGIRAALDTLQNPSRIQGFLDLQRNRKHPLELDDYLQLLVFCFDNFLSGLADEQRAVDDHYQQIMSPVAYISFIREMHNCGFIATNGSLYGGIASIIMDWFHKPTDTLAWLLVVCVSRGVLPFDELANIIQAISSEMLKDAREETLLAFTKLILQLLVGDFRQGAFPSAVSHVDADIFTISRQLMGSRSLEIFITSFAQLVERFTDQQLATQMLSDLLKNDFNLQQLACKSSVLQNCLKTIQHCTPTVCSHLIAAMYEQLYSISPSLNCDDDTGQQINLLDVLDNPKLEHALPLVKFIFSNISEWTIWLHSQMLCLFLGTMVQKYKSLPEQVLEDLLSPAMCTHHDHNMTNNTSSQTIRYYAEILCAPCHQFVDLKQHVINYVDKLVTVHTATTDPMPDDAEAGTIKENEKTHAVSDWSYEFKQICIIAVQCCKLDHSLADKMAINISTIINSVLRRIENVPCFGKFHADAKETVSSNQRFEILQQQVRHCLGIIREISSLLKSVPFELLRVLLSLLDHRLSQVDLITEEYDSDGQLSIHDMAHALLCKLHSSQQLHKQVAMFYKSQKRVEPVSTISTLNANYKKLSNWKIYEAYTGRCANCKSGKHGSQTPLLVNAKAVRRTHMLFRRPAQQIDTETAQVDGNNGHTVSSARNGNGMHTEEKMSTTTCRVGQKRNFEQAMYFGANGTEDAVDMSVSEFEKKKKYM